MVAFASQRRARHGENPANKSSDARYACPFFHIRFRIPLMPRIRAELGGHRCDRGKRMRHIFMMLLTAATLSAISATPSLAHARLERADPKIGATIKTSPEQLTLDFTEGLEPKFSCAEVRDAAGARVDTGCKVTGSTIHVSVKNLAPGVYTVAWHVLSFDTHKSEGNFEFRVDR